MITHQRGSLKDVLSARRVDGSTLRKDLFQHSGDYDYFISDLVTPNSFPLVISPLDGDLDSFFATVASYYPEIICVSALAHVLDADGMKAYVKHQSQSLSERPQASLSFLSALIIGEALAATRDGLMTEDPSYSDCVSTLAFAQARASVIFGTIDAEVTCARNWLRLRALTSIPLPSTSTELICSIARLTRIGSWKISSHGKFSLAISRYLRRLLSADTSASDCIFDAIRDFSIIDQESIAGLNGPFDSRLSSYLSSMKQVGDSKLLSNEESSFLVAFLCDRIQPGSLAHTNLLRKTSEVFPTSLVWYALVSMGGGSTDALGALRMKLERDIGRSFSFNDRPSCDVSIDELEVLNRLPLRSSMLKPSSERSLLVSLLPGVEVPWRFRDPSAVAMRRHSRSPNSTRAAKLLREAIDLLQRDSNG